MRRILIFSLAYYPRNIGGAEVAVKEITDRIDSSQCVFDMITIGVGRNLGGRLKGSATETIGNVTVYRVFKGIGPVQKLLFPFAAFFKALKLNRKQPYDAVWPIMASYAGFAAYLFKLVHPKVPMILTIQEGDNFERREGIFKCLFAKIFKSADHITAISTFLANWSKEMGAKCPIEVIPNGVDQALFRAEIAHDEVEALKEKLGKKPDDIFLVTASRLVYKNAVDDIISALQYLPANVKLLVIGAGALEGELKKQAIKLKLNPTIEIVNTTSRATSTPSNDSAQSNVNARVLFIGFIPHANLPNYLKSSDIFIRPSHSEGLGNSFLEAMAAGIPVIATPVGGIPDFLKDGETGLFCEVDNPRSIAQKVEKLLKDKESREYIVRNGRKMVEEKYQWGAIAERMKKVFDSVSISN